MFTGDTLFVVRSLCCLRLQSATDSTYSPAAVDVRLLPFSRPRSCSLAVFEGTPQEMDKALNTTLASLPDDTVCYVGHEYTKANVAFAASVDPDNEAIKQIKAFCDSNDMTTGKFTIGDEKKHNVRSLSACLTREETLQDGAQVFMRLDSDAVKKHTGATSATEAMAKLREMKVRFSLFTFRDVA